MGKISKRDLLIKMNISYGQLYRWKREELIPDEWFNKVSVPSGQETFFDEEQIIDRINTIILLKQTHSIEEIRKLLNNDGKEKIYSLSDVCLLEGIDEGVLHMYASMKGVSLATLIKVFVLSKVVKCGFDIGSKEYEQISQLELIDSTLCIFDNKWILIKGEVISCMDDVTEIKYDDYKTKAIKLVNDNNVNAMWL